MLVVEVDGADVVEVTVKGEETAAGLVAGGWASDERKERGYNRRATHFQTLIL